MSRNVKNKPPKIICKWCGDEISSYGLAAHIKHIHSNIGGVDGYVKEFGEFRKNKLTQPKGNRNISKVECKLCDKEFSIVGISTHLRDAHNLSSKQYIDQYGEYRPKYLQYEKRSVENNIQCLICDRGDFASQRHFSFHVRIDHGITMQQYALSYIFNDVYPKCECGCGIDTKIVGRPPYNRTFISGHNSAGKNNGMYGKYHNHDAKSKMSTAAIDRLHQTNKKNTDIELQFKNLLTQWGIQFEFQKKHQLGCYDFYLPVYDLYIEIDGDYFHPIILEKLNIQQIQSATSTYRKSKIHNLIRLRGNDISKLRTFNDVYVYNYTYDYTLAFKQRIVSKEYFTHTIENYGRDQIKQLSIALFNFIRCVHPEFPYPTTSENLNDVLLKIPTKIGSVFDLKNNTFNNNISNLGISYLKSKFRSYWKSSYKKNKSPIEIWYDDALMRKIIDYRIGFNNSGEIFDFSLHQLIRGISAIRGTISFFKPVLAAAIYKHFLGNTPNPIVLDPCAGFGGRMLGFKSIYPNGTYIGIEPNIETYNELVELSKNFNNIILINSKIEDADVSKLPKNIDLTFTSIPYYDIETYSNPIKYRGFDDWKSTFLISIQKLPNLILNVPDSLRNEFNTKNEYKLISNASHFAKEKNKIEYILDVSFTSS